MISIITPLLNEESYIGPYVRHLGTLQGDFELILVDGGSSDRTMEEIERNMRVLDNRITVLKTNAGRANQMNKGAEKANGNILLFLHADCFIPTDSLKTIEKEISTRKVVGGAFKHSFLHNNFFLKAVSSFGNLRSRLTKTFYGDSGIFLKRLVFREVGGYDLPFLEDVEICRKAKRYDNLIQIDHYILTSPRRYLSKGRLRLTIIFVLVSLLNFLGFRPRFFMNYLVNK
jgi:rSAM/selenodomain-associated transferase 2